MLFTSTWNIYIRSKQGPLESSSVYDPTKPIGTTPDSIRHKFSITPRGFQKYMLNEDLKIELRVLLLKLKLKPLPLYNLVGSWCHFVVAKNETNVVRRRAASHIKKNGSPDRQRIVQGLLQKNS